MDAQAVFERVPFVEHLGIEIREAADGHAEAALELRAELSSTPGTPVAHGGVTYSLADTVGGAAAVSRYETVTPTVDMRIDYLAPATGDLSAVADLASAGGSVAVADVDVYDGDPDGSRLATARGVYKVDGGDDDSPWTAGVDADPTA